MCDIFPCNLVFFFLSVKSKYISMSQIIVKEDIKIISKLIDFLAEGHDIETSRTFLELKDANGRAFRYISMKDRPHESNAKEQNRIDDAFHNMIERMSETGRPRTSLHTYLKDGEEDQVDEDEEEEGSDQED